MSVADFIKQLESNDSDIIYSTAPATTVQIMMPENQDSVVKIIPPINDHVNSVNSVDEVKPKKLKLKMKTKAVPIPVDTVVSGAIPIEIPREEPKTVEPTQSVVQPTYVQQTPVMQPVQQSVQPQVQQTIQPQVQQVQPTVVQQQIQQPVIEQPKEEPIEIVQKEPERPKSAEELLEELFISTGTEYSKRDLWIEYYQKAQASRKSNPISDRIRKGRFTITYDNKLLILPDYDVVGKDPDDILKDKWF